MDLNVEKSASNWRTILTSKNDSDWANGQPAGNTRRPAIYISGLNVSGPNRMQVGHQGATLPGQMALNVNQEISLAKWFNFTYTVDAASKKVTTYINGIKYDEATFPEAPAWASPSTEWYWNNDTYKQNGNGSIKVANAYFFQSVLSAADVAKLAIPTAIADVPTTSYYNAEPMVTGTDAYNKEMYTPY
jgi:hypothetical protein